MGHFSRMLKSCALIGVVAGAFAYAATASADIITVYGDKPNNHNATSTVARIKVTPGNLYYCAAGSTVMYCDTLARSPASWGRHFMVQDSPARPRTRNGTCCL